MKEKSQLTITTILQWADRHYELTGRWPISRSGPIIGAGERITWEAVQTALAKGCRGLPGGDSLSRLLKRRRKCVDSRTNWPDLTRSQVLEWIDDHYLRTGTWPQRDSGKVLSARRISWTTVDRYLKKGNRSLPGGSSLAQLLWEARGIWDGKQPLSEQKILRWAREHYEETGSWPTTTSGRLRNHPGEEWAALNMALTHRRRGLTRTTTLSRLLAEHYGERYRPSLGRITMRQIVDWAERHYARYGRWPTARSGAVHGAQRLTWAAINNALKSGTRGLPAGMTLAQVLDEHFDR